MNLLSKQKNKKGFTLIEMIVVIAIVGILSATVLTALAPSKNKAKDTRIISALNQIKVMAEIYYNEHNSYTGLASDAAVVKLLTEITNNGGGVNTAIGSAMISVPTTGNIGQSYTAASKTSTGLYCVDSDGESARTFGTAGITCIPSSP